MFNHTNRIHLVLGSRKITEGYNLLGVNSIYILELPY